MLYRVNKGVVDSSTANKRGAGAGQVITSMRKWGVLSAYVITATQYHKNISSNTRDKNSDIFHILSIIGFICYDTAASSMFVMTWTRCEHWKDISDISLSIIREISTISDGGLVTAFR